MKYLVTGGAGFIGSNIVDALLKRGDSVRVIDNLSTGSMFNLKEALKSPGFEFHQLDLFEAPEKCTPVYDGVDVVIHMAANADVRFGTENPTRDLKQNTIVTSNVLESMRLKGVKKIAFASTGSVYGEPEVFPTPETAPFPVQTSLYAASKIAAEGLISAYSTGLGMQGYIFRFVSVLGPRYSHGHVIDFARSLKKDPKQLHILGDGRQTKSYMHAEDCVDGILLALERARDAVNILNLGNDATCEVRDSARWICERMGLQPEFTFAGGKRGWVGDSPLIHLDNRRITALGWQPKYTIRGAVESTVDYLLKHPEMLEA